MLTQVSQIKECFEGRMLLTISRISISFFALILTGRIAAEGQCVKLPYRENFEASDGGWTTGGVASDWEWGQPAKSILIPLDGKKCWTTGGLTKSSYNNDQLSWLQSPCFDFSTIQYPYVVFRMFSDTETNFDGAVFEYSTNNGLAWKTVGSINDPVDCLNTNWFNTLNIKYLNNSSGWSGSNFWLWANHVMPFLVGEKTVTFRFLFGAGSVYNNFNGFAIDDFYVGESDSTDARFSYNCTSSTTVDFKIQSLKGCPDFYWDFDDSASGILNTSDQISPTHTFSKPGQYKVRLSTTGVYNTPSSTTQVINILDPDIQIVKGPDCQGLKNGIASVSTSPAVAGAVYNWATNPAQVGDTAVNLAAGIFRVYITAPNSCPAQDEITIIEPTALSNSTTVTQPNCNKTDGSIELGTAGGTSPYNYTWWPNVSNGASAFNLWAGPYSILVKDANGCSQSVYLDLSPVNGPVASISNKQDPPCWGNGGKATVGISGGEPPYTYTWSPAGGSNASAFFVTGGDYNVAVTDINGCTDTASVNIFEPVRLVSNISKQDVTCGNANGKATADITGGALPYSYSWASTSGTYSSQVIDHLPPDDYYLTVTDANGCKISDQVTIASTGANALNISLGADTTICQPGSIVLTPGAFNSYSWHDGSTNANYTITGPGHYSVTVTDTHGCTGSAGINVIAGCAKVFFPGSFTPNGDNLNEYFGPLGDFRLVKNYHLKVFNRWGQLVFQSTDPFIKWDGRTGGLINKGAYTWVASYTTAESNQKQKGTVVML